MLLSMYNLKSLISIGIVITLLIGVALLYVLVYSFIISSIAAQVQADFRNLFIAVFLTTSILLIFSSLSGIYGLIRKKNKFIVIYAITMVIYFVVFILIGTYIGQYPNELTKGCNSEQNSSYEDTINAANSTLCKSCQCYFTNQAAYSPDELEALKALTNVSINDELPVNAENCPLWSNTTYPLTTSFVIFQSFFNCSGWCPLPSAYNLYYLFTNINRGKPTQSCVDSLMSFFNKFGTILQISSFCVSGFLLLILITILCLCLHPDRKLRYDSLQIFKETLMFIEEEEVEEKKEQKKS